MEKELIRCTKFSVVSRTVELPNGLIVEREIVIHPGAAVIVPILDSGELIMLRQYRPAVERYLLEFPAGTLDGGNVGKREGGRDGVEDHRVCAERELVEETGFRAGALEYLGEIIPAPGFCNEIQHLYLATQLTFVGSAPEEGEILEEQRVEPKDFFELVGRGEITDCKSIAAFVKAKASGKLGL